MKEIKLGGKTGKGLVALVDDADFEWLKEYSWFCDSMGYARTNIRKKSIKMHRFIMNAKPGQWVDHANNNPLDNRRSNLRFANKFQNAVNRIKKKPVSGFHGVSKNWSKWQTRLKVKKKEIYIGSFENSRHAALAYDLWINDIYKEFAVTNFPIVKPKL